MPLSVRSVIMSHSSCMMSNTAIRTFSNTIIVSNHRSTGCVSYFNSSDRRYNWSTSASTLLRLVELKESHSYFATVWFTIYTGTNRWRFSKRRYYHQFTKRRHYLTCTTCKPDFKNVLLFHTDAITTRLEFMGSVFIRLYLFTQCFPQNY